MISIDKFIEIAGEIVDEIPDILFKELSGGVVVREEEMLHPQRKRDDLYILGEYVRNHSGMTILLFYGSFVRMFEFESTEFITSKIREVVRHELRHHMEGLSGIKDLEIEDQEYLERYWGK
ncbi:MAG: metallopeptidase family protein [Peptostreptococcaceae bacterium]|nr:metallopeptidase family protein [Peptostreptococcaceae bacterium]